LTRSYTPQIAYIVPQVVFPNFDTAFYINFHLTPRYKVEGELPYKSAEVSGFLLNLAHFGVDESSVFPENTFTMVRGLVGANVPPNSNATVKFRDKAGYAHLDYITGYTCDITGNLCYAAKVVPVIETVSSNSGLIAGGQVITMTGFGLK
jgi:hypothetical protein